MHVFMYVRMHVYIYTHMCMYVRMHLYISIYLKVKMGISREKAVPKTPEPREASDAEKA